MVLSLAIGAGVRLGAQTEPGRAAVVRLLEGGKIGRFGRLKVVGLSGDFFHDFTIRRVELIDRQGPWIAADNLRLQWAPLELIVRRFHARSLTASKLQVMRQPVLEPDDGKKGGEQPLSLIFDQIALKLETLPAATERRGLWTLAAQARINRDGGAAGRLDAKSLLHAGDGAAMVFDVGQKGRISVAIDATEGQGGALAGGLGLSAGERLVVRGRVTGDKDQGALSIESVSGRLRPITAKGSWNRAGARIDGKVLLSASTRARFFSDRLGPEAAVSLRSRQLKGDLYQVDARVIARDGSLIASGPVDWRRRRTPGAQLTLAVSDIERWQPLLDAKATRAVGKVVGGLDDWRYEAALDVQKIDQLDYSLGRLTGPGAVAFKKGVVSFKAKLDGVGGGGRGVVAALLGARPTIAFDGDRLKDDRYLIRSIDVKGSGGTIKAAGDRSLLGAVTLKGQAELTDLKPIWTTARGVVRASWNASQSSNKPWSVGFDATGADFASGAAELDRLLGPRPALKGELTWGEAGWAFQRADLNGEALQASARGTLNRANILALDVNWKARGPFGFGPVEIAGEASGDGHVGGVFGAPVVDLNADLASLDVGKLMVKPAKLTLLYDLSDPAGAKGRIAVSGPSNYGPATAKADFRFLASGVALSAIDADAGGVKAQGALALVDGAPSTADLKVSARAGAFLNGGELDGMVKIAERAGGATASIGLSGKDLLLPGMGSRIKTVRFSADGPWARLPFQLSADGDDPWSWRFAGGGTLDQTGDVREISLTGQGRVRRANLTLTQPAILRLAPGERSLRASAAMASGTGTLDARMTGDLLDIKARVDGVELAPFAYDYVGRFGGSLNLSGRGASLSGALEAMVEEGRSRDAPADVALTGKARAVLQGGRILLTGSATNPQGLKSSLDLNLPAEASAAPFRIALVRNQPMSGAFSADGEVRPLWDLFAGAARSLSGRVSTEGKLSGTLASPRASGRASLDKGRFQDAYTGLVLDEFSAQATFDQDAVRVGQFSGLDGRGGTLSGSGEVNMARGGASSFTLDLKKFQLVQNDIARASASGQVVVTRDESGKARLVGKLTVDRADVTAKPPVPTGVLPMEVVEINRPRREDVDLQPRPTGPQIALDVSITAARGVFLRGNGLDAELSLIAHVGGRTDAPELSGTARIVRGSYDFAGKRFEFDDRGTVRLASRPEAIRLDLIATRDDPSLTAVVRIEGTAAKPLITLTSTPVLPQDEVLAQVLFGRSESQLTPLETAQLAAALASLATGGGFDVLGGLRQITRLDRLALGGGAEGAAVSGGKYLTDDVYIELTGGGRTGPSGQVEWRVRRNLSIVSSVASQGDARLSVRFRKNF